MNNHFKIDKHSQKILDELLKYNINKRYSDINYRFNENYFKINEKINKFIQDELRDEYEHEMRIVLNNLKLSLPYDHGEQIAIILPLGLAPIALFRQDIILGLITILFGFWVARMYFLNNKVEKYNKKIDFISNNLIRFVNFPFTIQGRLNELKHYVENQVITYEVFLAIKENFFNKLKELEEEKKVTDSYYKHTKEDVERYEAEYNSKYQDIVRTFLFFRI